MVIHIALVGKDSGHLWNGLKEIIPAEKLFLLHSPNNDEYKFENAAKELKKQVEKTFCETVLVKINPFEMSNIFNKIDEIINDEIKKSNYQLNTFDFAIGVTGGTNIMASGATIGAMLTGAKAYYVQDDRRGPKRKSYSEFLPIPPINILRRLSNSHLKILQTLAKGEFEFNGEKHKGVMKNKDLEKKLKTKTSTLNSALKTLAGKNYIEILEGVPVLVEKQVDLDQKPILVTKMLKNQNRIKILELGKLQAKKAIMSK